MQVTSDHALWTEMMPTIAAVQILLKLVLFANNDPIFLEVVPTQFLSKKIAGILINVRISATWTLVLVHEWILCLLFVTLLAHACLAFSAVPYLLKIKVLETNDARDRVASIYLDIFVI